MQHLNLKFEAPKLSGFKGLGMVGADASSKENCIKEAFSPNYYEKARGIVLWVQQQHSEPIGNTKAELTL